MIIVLMSDKNKISIIRLIFDLEWNQPQDGKLEEETKRSYYLAIIPRRADHYRLKLTGKGGCRVYSLTREISIGSAMDAA